MMLHALLAVFLGALGGVLNCVLFEKGFVWPSKDVSDVKRMRYDPGFVGNLLLGMGASLIIWGLGAKDFPAERMVAVCVLSGIGGGSLITSLLQKNQLEVAESKVQVLNDGFQSLLDSIKEKADDPDR